MLNRAATSAKGRPHGPSQMRSERWVRWMTRAQQGDREAYGALLHEVRKVLASLLRRHVSDRNEIEDICQETLIAFHRARHSYQPSRPVEPWLLGIARHVLAEYARRRRRRFGHEVLVDVAPDPGLEGDGAARLYFEQALANLPPAQRKAFALLQLEGLSVRLAAARMGVSTSALKVRAHRAYKTLRESLRRA